MYVLGYEGLDPFCVVTFNYLLYLCFTFSHTLTSDVINNIIIRQIYSRESVV